MTKKRFRFGLAALGLCATFLVALISLLLAPTLASADNNSGTAHGNEQTYGGAHGSSGGAPNPIYFQNGTDPANGPGNSSGGPTESCADNDKSCTGSGDKPDGQYFDAGGSTGASGNGNSGSSNGSGHGGNGGGNGAPGFNSGFYAGGNGGNSGSGGNGSNSGNGGSGGGGNGGNGSDNGDKGGIGDGHHPPDPPDLGPPTFLIPQPDGPGPDGPQPPVSTDDPLQVPEPLTMSLFAVGLAGTAAMRRRQKYQ